MLNLSSQGSQRSFSLVTTVQVFQILWLSPAILTGMIQLTKVAPAQATQLAPAIIYDYFNTKYSVHLMDIRGACGYYMDPEDVYERGNERVTTITVTAGQSGGTACFGVRKFMPLQVNCKNMTGQVLELQGIGRSARWDSQSIDPEAVEKVCGVTNVKSLPSHRSGR
ncbi:hypothetical protein [Alkalinema pantanalense]|uniref:hypothetical protein n=1 Tax=Alkalinema pantanalense TaxID=1620705 RepID=UPI003D7009AD